MVLGVMIASLEKGLAGIIFLSNPSGPRPDSGFYRLHTGYEDL